MKKKPNRFTEMKSKFVSLQTKTMRNFILGLLDIAEKNPESDYFVIQSDDNARLEFTIIDADTIIAYCGKASLEIRDSEDETYIAGSINSSKLTADKTLDLIRKLNDRFKLS